MRTTILSVLLLSPALAFAADARPDGKALFKANCARCHGAEGKATPENTKKGVPDLNDADWQAFRSDDEIRDIVTNGSKGTPMVGFKGRLTPAEIDAVIGYVRKLTPAK